MVRPLAIGLVALALAAPASAGTIIVRLTLASGPLAVVAPQATLTDQAPLQVQLTLRDGRGTGAGWTLSANANVTVTGITARCTATSTCTLPTATGASTGRTVLSTQHDTGMGVMVLTVTLAPLARGSASVPLAFTVR